MILNTQANQSLISQSNLEYEGEAQKVGFLSFLARINNFLVVLDQNGQKSEDREQGYAYLNFFLK